MRSVKETLNEKWWIIFVALFLFVKILPSNSSNKTEEYHSSSRNSHENYYKWPCRFCGKRLPLDKMLSPNKYPYTPENGFVFCSQECYHAFQLLKYK
jgi:hypothetical protein